MAQTTVDTDLMLRRFKALSDDHRLRILDRLRGGEKCVCELVDIMDAKQSLLSFHLRILREAGLVTDRRDGRWVHYTLSTDALREVEEFVGTLRERVPGTRWTPACC